MRLYLLLVSTALLAACGGGTQTLGSTPGPIGGGGGVGSTGSTSTHTFVAPTESKTYVGVGGSQVFDYLTDDRDCCNQQGQQFAGHTSTVRSSEISIGYDPREATFTLKITDPLSGAEASTRFQDPASRTDFGGAKEPQWGTPNLPNPNLRYLQAGDGNPLSPYDHSGTGFIDPGTNAIAPMGGDKSTYQAASLFYLKPGTETQYVTYAGYIRNAYTFNIDRDTGILLVTNKLERGAFAFGEMTAKENVPSTGTGTYTGSMLATLVFNPTMDGQDIASAVVLPTYFQWLHGTSTVNVDFANNSFQLALAGTVTKPFFDHYTGPRATVLAAGATFAAAGTGSINMINFGGFKGQFQSARFTNTDGTVRNVTIGGSSIDGTFYGPAANEVGGGFHIAGGNPDERIDVLGAFVGKK